MQLNNEQDETVNNILSLLHSMKNGKDMISGYVFSREELIKFSGQLYDVIEELWQEIACDHTDCVDAPTTDDIRCADLNERLGDVEDEPWLIGAKLNADRS